jgi:hypothetical protein
MTEAGLQRLLAERKIESVEPDPETAREEIATARRHIEAAGQIAGLDPTLAFTGLYDAMRKAIQAHMRANGYRISKGPRGHVKIGEYALAALDALDIQAHLDEFDALRTIRNQSEYEAMFVQPEDVPQALEHAQAIVDAVARALAL